MRSNDVDFIFTPLKLGLVANGGILSSFTLLRVNLVSVTSYNELVLCDY